MPAGTYDFMIEQGTSFVTTFIWKTQPGACCDNDAVAEDPVPVDLTGYSLAMQVRPSAGSETLYFEASSANGRLVIVSPEIGMFALQITAAESSTWEWKRGVYDMEMTSPTSVVTRLLQGRITVSPEVTVETTVEAEA